MFVMIISHGPGPLAQEIKTDYDRNADFSRYKTYSFEKIETTGSFPPFRGFLPDPGLSSKWLFQNGLNETAVEPQAEPETERTKRLLPHISQLNGIEFL